ncbi:MAG: hypothetical protein HQK52_18375 [Oligoflexia bacterium]|nr:hypothetical protein [Oligoflexia bacterium]
MQKIHIDKFLITLVIAVLLSFAATAAFAKNSNSNQAISRSVTDKEIKTFLIAQAIDLNQIWIDHFEGNLTPAEEKLLTSQRFNMLPITLQNKIKTLLLQIRTEIDTAINQQMHVSFLGNRAHLPLRKERAILKKALLPYFSLNSLKERIARGDEYLLDTPSTPFALTLSKVHKRPKVTTYQNLAQSSKEFAALEDRYQEAAPTENFVERHRTLVKVLLKAMILSGKFAEKLQAAPDLYQGDLQAQLSDQAKIDRIKSVCAAPNFMNTMETSNTCPANSPIPASAADAINYFSGASGAEHVQLLHRLQSYHLPPKVMKLIPSLLTSLSAVSPSLHDKLFQAYQSYSKGEEQLLRHFCNNQEQASRLLRLLDFGIHKLPSQQEVLYHAVPAAANYAKDNYKVGEVIYLKDYLTATHNPQVALDNLQSNTLFTIHAKDAKSIAAFSESPAKEEYLIIPEHALEVVSVENDRGSILHVTLVERGYDLLKPVGQ